MTDITDAKVVYVSTSKNADYVSATDHEGCVKYIRADAPELVALVESINALGRAFDKARMIPRPGSGVGGMSIEANIRGSVYNGVDACQIEEVRTAIVEFEELTK